MKHHRGFTLLEIMLVMLLLGLMASYVVVNFVSESRTSRIQKETDRLQQLVQVVSETAILKQQDFGLMLNAKGYQFLVHNGQQWLEVSEPKSLQFHPWPEAVQAELELEGLSWAEDSILGQEEFRKLQEEVLEQQAEAAEDDEDKDDKTKAPAKTRDTPLLPNIYILSSGDISPFQLVLADETERPFWYQVLKGEYSIPLTKSEVENDRP
ncbi:MAG: type II secretion system minor pseudopilin GspH [Gammaproteobacteria bacterium]|nr:type II secretion system minor pseudopilin GspH [Gammaproteobacteria bacterium]